MHLVAGRDDRPVIRPRPGREGAGDEMLSAAPIAPAQELDGDDRLMWRLRGRDEAALGTIYDRHAGVAYGLALRMLRDQPAAEEVVQDAFLALWRNAAVYQPDRASLRTWLLTIVRNRAVDRLRRHATRGPAVALEECPELVAADDTWLEATDGIRAAAVRRAVGELPAAQRQILEWAYFGGLSQREIAARSGLALGTVKSRTRLGLEHLRQLLGGSVAAEAREW